MPQSDKTNKQTSELPQSNSATPHMRMDLVSSLLGESLITSRDYLTLPELFRESTFSLDEQEVILYALNHHNRCDTCLSSHTNLHEDYSASNQFISDLIDGASVTDEKVSTLLAFIKDIIDEKAQLASDKIITFLTAGYTQKNVMELITAHAMQSIKNYTYHIGAAI
jgi:AhpD family alkylhydroperoxidase